MFFYLEITQENMKQHTKHENIRGEGGKANPLPAFAAPNLSHLPLPLSPVALDLASCHSDTTCPWTPGRGRAIDQIVDVKLECDPCFAIGSKISTHPGGGGGD